MSPKKFTPMSDQKLIIEMLQSLLSRSEQSQKDMAEVQSRIASIEASARSQAENNNRFWTTTWPAEQRTVQLLEERIRLLEQDRVTSEKVEKLETSVMNKMLELSKNVPTKHDVEKIDTIVGNLADRMVEVEKKETADSTKSKMVFGVLALLGSSIVSVLIHALFKHLGA